MSVFSSREKLANFCKQTCCSTKRRYHTQQPRTCRHGSSRPRTSRHTTRAGLDRWSMALIGGDAHSCADAPSRSQPRRRLVELLCRQCPHRDEGRCRCAPPVLGRTPSRQIRAPAWPDWQPPPHLQACPWGRTEGIGNRYSAIRERIGPSINKSFFF